MAVEMTIIRSTVKPAVMVCAVKYKELCPEQPVRRLQIVFNRKNHLAKVDIRVAKYLVDTFEEIQYLAPIIEPPKVKKWTEMNAEERAEYKRNKDDKGRDSNADNP